MGAWGYGPYENDDAGDMIDSIQDCKTKEDVSREICRCINSDWEMERRAAAVYVLEKFSIIPCLKDFLPKAKKVLKSLYKNEEFTNTWDDPKAYKAILKSELELIKRIMEK